MHSSPILIVTVMLFTAISCSAALNNVKRDTATAAGTVDCNTEDQNCVTELYANRPPAGYDEKNGDACRAMKAYYVCHKQAVSSCDDQQQIDQINDIIAGYDADCPSTTASSSSDQPVQP